MRLRLRTDRAIALPMSPGQYRLVGGLLIVFGLLLFAASALLVNSMVNSQGAAQERRAAAAQACSDTLTNLGMEVTTARGVITARLAGLDSAAVKLGRASAASLMCPGWRLSRFCMGEACQVPNAVLLELRPS